MALNAIVSGASRGIGRSIAHRLAREGYSVGINDIPEASADIDNVISEINSILSFQHSKPRPGAVALPGDVSSSSDVASMVSKAVTKLGPLTLMVANAGIAPVTPLLLSSTEEVDRILGINVRGVFNCYTEAAKQMISQGDIALGAGITRYKLVGAASIAAFRAFPGCGIYSASKFAVRGLTQATAAEMARHNITVNAYAPGIVGTPMWDEVDEGIGEIEGRPKGKTLEAYSKGIPLGRAGVPEDVAGLVGGFLASKDSDYVTGQTMLVDGGIVFN
ncbi:hypothetical protein N7478_001352 [Penicillium angulare]|uniref:uncharacterized protein n=1 Tax=Penicillium angulare TaxID=116970 RepID=UPI0025408AD7|nr:uncharacterized protein N7478_001352 [Penicillium angulare]KAJ5292101.1 hypothetical protein N7478_001352 [Penicillium angulare]